MSKSNYCNRFCRSITDIFYVNLHTLPNVLAGPAALIRINSGKLTNWEGYHQHIAIHGNDSMSYNSWHLYILFNIKHVSLITSKNKLCGNKRHFLQIT